MNKLKIALIAGAGLIALGVPNVVRAQTAPAASGPFADVPADHWAYQSVDTLQKAGIVIGYPDGTYGGKRAMTRYEFAVAIARLLPLLQNNNNYATKDDLAALRSDLEQKLQANSDAIDALQKLVDEFQPELEKLGQDVAAVKDRLDALEARVAAVEEEQRRVRFTGALNIIAEGEDLTKGSAFADQNGGVASAAGNLTYDVPPAGTPGTATKHILTSTDVFHDFLLNIDGKVSDTATAHIKLDFGNYLSGGVGNTAAPDYSAGGITSPSQVGGTALGTLNAGSEATTVWEADLDSPVSLGPLGGADLTVGRFGNQTTRYTLQQIDADVYTALWQTDDGNIPTDGAKVNFKLGPVGLSGWAGQTKAVPFAQPYGGSTGMINPLTGGVGGYQNGSLPGLNTSALLPIDHASPLQQGAGARATIGNPDRWILGATVEQFGLTGMPLDADTHPGLAYGVLSVYGLDFNGAVPLLSKTGLTLDANWTDAANGYNSRSFNDIGNGYRYDSTDDELGLKIGELSLKGGYQYVGPDFSAPGNWGRAGSWINPTNIEGPVGSAKLAVSRNLSLNGDVESWKTAYGGESSPLQAGDKLARYQVGLGYGLTSTYNVDLGYEQDNWTLSNNAGSAVTGIASGKPTQSYVTIGVGHTFSQNASFKLLYQIDQYKDKGTGFGSTAANAAGDTDYDSTGNVAVGQFSLKF
jgi:FtsZ-binding cell division protein ZapB